MSRTQYDAATVVSLKDLSAGDTVIVDDGFTCIPQWASRIVFCNKEEEHFVHCGKGEHYLEGQVGDGGTLVGVRLLRRATK